MTCFINIKTSNILLKVENIALARKSYTSYRRFYIIINFLLLLFVFPWTWHRSRFLWIFRQQNKRLTFRNIAINLWLNWFAYLSRKHCQNWIIFREDHGFVKSGLLCVGGIGGFGTILIRWMGRNKSRRSTDFTSRIFCMMQFKNLAF